MFAFQFTLSGLWHLFFVRLRLSVFFLCVGQLLLIYACCALGVCHVFIIVFAALSKASTPSCLAVMFFFLVSWRNDNMPGTRFGAVAYDVFFLLGPGIQRITGVFFVSFIHVCLPL